MPKSSTAQMPAANAAGQPLDYLKNAPSKFYAIQGTIATGASGLQQVTWQQSTPPIIPAYLKAVHLNFQCNINVVLGPANPSSCTISHYAPYSIWSNQLTLGGAPPWPIMELTPWHLDNIACRIDYDDAYFGLALIDSGLAAANGTNFFSAIVDLGQAGWVDTIGQATPPTGGATATGNICPGTALSNTTGGATTVTLHCTFNLTIRLQRRRHLLWGAVPFGDPENRPNHILQLNNLVGTQPEQNLVTNVVGTVTAATTGTTTVTAVYELSYIDLLPSGVNLPEPTVGFGLQVVPSTNTTVAQNVYATTTHRTAMACTGLHHILVNGQLPVQSNYFALWDDQDPQSARWQFDSNLNSFHQYFVNFLKEKRRPPILGWYLADLENGQFPEIPSVTPLDQIVSADATYAAAFGVAVTPAITTVVRLPGAVSGSAYVRTYDFGLVKVPY